MPSLKSKTSIAFHHLADFLPPAPSRVKLRKIEILEAVIKLCANGSMDDVTYESVAQSCQVTRQLVQHYFPDRDLLFLDCFRYIRAHLQKMTVDAISAPLPVAQTLDLYVSVIFRWPERHPSHARTWLLFFALCTGNRKFRHMHTELVDIGHARILAFLDEARLAKRIRSCDLAMVAKEIQVHLTGALVTLLTEEHTGQALRALEKSTRSRVRSIAGLVAGAR